MPSTTINLTHSNASIYGVISPDALYGDVLSLGTTRMVFAFTGTQLQFYFQQDYPATGKGLGIKIDGGAEFLVEQAGADYNTITDIVTGLSEGVHVCEVNLDYNSQGVGNTKFKPSSHTVVTGAAPAIAYASGYGRGYHTGNNANATDVYRLGPQLAQNDNGASIASLTGGYNGGGQFAFKSDAPDFRIYYRDLGGGTARFTLFDSTGAIVTSGSVTGASTGETTLNTGLSAGTVREYTLGFSNPPASILAVGGTMQEGGSKPVARDVMAVTGTSITVSAGATAWTPEVGGSQLPLLRGCFAFNLGVGGSTLIGSSGTNESGQERLGEIIAQNPAIVTIEAAANDENAGTSAATFGAAYQTYLTDLIAGCSNLTKIYCAPWWTLYRLNSAYTAAIQAAVSAANTASGTSKCVFIDTSSFRGSVSTYDSGIHPDRAGALYAAQQLSAKIQATLDNTAPTLSSVATSTGGVQVTATFNEAMGTGATGFTIKINGTSASQLSSSWTSTTTLVFVLARGITSADTVTLDYSAGNVADVAGNALATITGRSVTNNSTVSGGGSGNRSRMISIGF